MGARLWGATAVAVAATLSGCSGEGSVAVGRNPDVEVSVSAGVSPVYSWSGPRAERLRVVGTTNGRVSWEIRALDPAEGFASPVEHGILPQTATEVSQVSLLEDGVTYRVTLEFVGGGRAETDFTP